MLAILPIYINILKPVDFDRKYFWWDALFSASQKHGRTITYGSNLTATCM